MAPAQRSKATRPSSPAGDEPDLEVDGDEEDPCGYGCHRDGVPDGAVSIGCEHGTFEVTPGMRRKVAAVSVPPQTVHDRSVHFPAEEAPASPAAAQMAELLALVNGYGERLLIVENTVRKLVEHVASADEPGE